jgi:hypothetical protein
MNIFLRRIPANAKHAEITEFVTPALKTSFFRKPGRILNVEILALQDIRIGTMEYHGLVTLDSEAAVANAVKGLKNRRLNGRIVLVRPYYHRSWYNDPRRQQNPANKKTLERRKGDRRRGQYLQIIKNVSDRFNSEDDFFNTINHQQLLMNLIVPTDLEPAVLAAIADFETLQSNTELTNPDVNYQTIRYIAIQNAALNSSNLQIYAEKKASAALLEILKNEFKDSDIHYWVLPVIDKGQF